MKTTIAILLTVLVGVSSAGEHPARTKFSKSDPKLKPVKCPVDEDYEGALCWSGQLSVSGTLVIEFDRTPNSEDGEDQEGQATFEPDSTSRRKLPAAVNYHPLPVNVTWLRNRPREILTPLIGAMATQEVMTGTLGRYEFMVDITLTSFATSIDCDHRSYGIGYSVIRLRREKYIASANPRSLGC